MLRHRGTRQTLPWLSSFFELLSVHKSEGIGAEEGASQVDLVWKGYRERITLE